VNPQSHKNQYPGVEKKEEINNVVNCGHYSAPGIPYAMEKKKVLMLKKHYKS
jgi:hypothetical protein